MNTPSPPQSLKTTMASCARHDTASNCTTQTLGKVYLVGAGPGAADLITVRGASILGRADIVLYDALIEPEMLSYCQQAKLVAVGKRCGRHSSAQSFINKRLIDAAHKNACVVRLKGGDPMVFGRAQEELDALHRAGIACEVVPGISAALAAAASLQQSLTVRGVSRSVALCTLAHAPGSKAAATPQADTLALYMGRKQTQDFAAQLIESGKSAHTPVIAMTGVSTPRETLSASTLGTVAQRGFDAHIENEDAMLILVGEVWAKHIPVRNSSPDVHKIIGRA